MSPSTHLFLRILLDKKYALPYRVLDSLVLYFLSSGNATSSHTALTVLWHQSLLVFAQRYKSELVPQQKDAILEMLGRVKTKGQGHVAISAEVRRELVNSTCRGEVVDIDMMAAV